MNQIKRTVEERISSMEGQVADLRDMMKKLLEIHNQTAASVAKVVEGKNTNSEILKAGPIQAAQHKGRLLVYGRQTMAAAAPLVGPNI
ncbi:hypothetical protein M5K25_015383 [Dendrobium thyrsiflorum]|uniref:Uncharacterized protein n=1 Tax=Dendrobium thyrsiflorum TaxID=117978 RepID=A0ABD0UQ78_DENTH